MIKLSHVHKYYHQGKNNEIHVINDVSFTLKDTGFVTLFGASGSGKTTLLNVIGGLDKATGVIEYNDEKFEKYCANKIDQYRRQNIGYIFQNYNLLPDKTVWENLRIALEVINITDEEEVKKRIEYCLKAVGLYKFRKKPAFALSGGQMQRVSIARALVKNCKIIIADEPTGNLDSDNSIEIMEILKKISQKTLVLLVTHDRQLAEFYSDEIIEIKDGSVINQRLSNEHASLNRQRNENVIYLKDMHHIEQDDHKVKVQIYTDFNDFEKIELQLVQKNNQFILKANCPIKLLEDTPIQFIDDHYKEIKKNQYQQNFAYDTSWYENKTSKKASLKKVKNDLIYSLKSFFFSKTKAKFFSGALFLIGMIIGFLNIALVSYCQVDERSLNYDSQVYGLSSYVSMSEYDKYEDFIKQGVKDNQIEEIYFAESMDYYLVMHLSTFHIRSFPLSTVVFDDTLIANDSLVCGRSSQNEDEYVVSKLLADEILEKLKIKEKSYDVLLNHELFSSVQTIVGVVNRDCKAMYHNISKQSFIVDVDDHSTICLTAKDGYLYRMIDDEKSREVLNPFEGLCHQNSPYQVGDEVYGIKIVGKYEQVDSLSTNTILVSKNTYAFLKNQYFYGGYNFLYSCYFKANNLSTLQQYFKNHDYEIDQMYFVLKSNLLQENQTAKMILIPVMICLSCLSLVYIYFTMRSKMISDIYSIGVLRALGNSKLRMMQKYFIDTLVITFFTTLIGYLIVCFGYGWFANRFKDVLSLALINNYWTTYFFAIAILVVNCFIGLLPIFTLLFKTPSEIIAKYDI